MAQVAELISEGVALHSRGQLDEAAAIYRTVLQDDPRQPDALHLLGLVHRQKGELDVGRELIRQAIDIYPENPSYHFNLANIERAQGRPADALAGFQAALAIAPDHFRAALGRAQVLNRLRRYRDGEAAFRELLRSHPELDEAWAGLGIALRAQGRNEEAIIAYEAALERAPGNTNALFNLGEVFQFVRRLGDAIGVYRKALERNPHQPEVLLNLGMAYYEVGELDKAAECDRKAIALRENYAPAYGNLGVALLESGDFEGARTNCGRAVELDPTCTPAWTGLGRSLEALGRQEEAQGIFDYPGLVREYRLDPPDGWSDMTTFNADLTDHIYNHPTFQFERERQAVDGVSQTRELLTGDSPMAKALRQILESRLAAYLPEMLASRGLLEAIRIPDSWRLESWAVVAHPSARVLPHVHASAFVSGVYYVRIPEPPEPIRSNEGSIVFSSNREFGQEGVARFVDDWMLHPKEGHLLLFPSYFVHQTIPVSGDIDRISIAFDMKLHDFMDSWSA